MLKCLIALTSLLSTAAVAATVWTWVDEQGQRHYSDRPVPGATQIEVADSQTFTAPPVTRLPQAEAAAQASAEPASYSVLEIVSPEEGATLWNIGAMLTLEVAMYPPLKAEHHIDAMLDGERIETNARDLSLTISDVFRGAHQVQAIISDAEGSIVMRSPTVMFYVQQTSLLNPNNPNSATNPARRARAAPRN